MTNQRYRNTYIDGCSHFCTASVTGFLPVLDDDEMKRILLRAIERCRRRYQVLIEGFVIMPEHIHLLVRGKGESVRKFMQYTLSQSSSQIREALENRASNGIVRASNHLAYLRARANGESVGKVWKERFRAVALDREDAVLVKLEYLHNNPVRRGLVESPEDWEWSSARHYLGGESVLDVDTVFGG